MDELLPWSPGLGELTPVISSHRITPGQAAGHHRTRSATATKKYADSCHADIAPAAAS